MKDNKLKFFGIFTLLFLQLWIIVGCYSTDSSSNNFVTAQRPLDSPDIMTPPINNQVIATFTPVGISTLMTITSNPSPSVTLIPAEKEVIISELYDTNANCKLPCWWGITPGETNWDSTKRFLETISSEMYFYGRESESDLDFGVEVDTPVSTEFSEFGNLRHTFIVENGVIVKIKPEGPLGTKIVNNISDILNNYGLPTEVWIDTIGYTFGDNYYPFRIILFYPEKGFLVKYFDEAEKTDDQLIGCPQGQSARLVLWSPKQELLFVESLSKQDGVQYYKPLEETTDMNLETFYQTYLDPNTDVCIETPAELWMDK